MASDPKAKFGILMKQQTHRPFQKDFSVTGGPCEHQALSKKVSFKESPTFYKRRMENT